MAPEREAGGLREQGKQPFRPTPIIRPSSLDLQRAVADARRLRGSVVFGPEGGPWGAIVAAVDGSLEIRVSPPGRLRLRARKWLGAHGFTHVFDAWHAPLDASVPDEDAARLLSEALEAAHGVSAGRRTFESRGVLDDDRPPAGAPPEAHVAAALRTLIDGRRRGVSLGAGRPERPWGYVWGIDGELVVERDEPGRPGEGSDTWRAPLTPAGCESVAEELVRRAQGADSPLFIQLLDHDK